MPIPLLPATPIRLTARKPEAIIAYSHSRLPKGISPARPKTSPSGVSRTSNSSGSRFAPTHRPMTLSTALMGKVVKNSCVLDCRSLTIESRAMPRQT